MWSQDGPHDDPQEMERNEATAKHVVWLLLHFFPFFVGHSAAAPSTQVKTGLRFAYLLSAPLVQVTSPVGPLQGLLQRH